MHHNSGLLRNAHQGLPPPEPESSIWRRSLIRGDCLYYHYGCDGLDDRGWGCGYRTLQTLSSWICFQTPGENATPSPGQIQEALVQIQDKPPGFAGSRSWIGSFEIALCLESFHRVPCKIVHVRRGAELPNRVDELHRHFERFGSPAMMGGDSDNGSKAILGVCSGDRGHYLLVLDPHYHGPAGSVQKETAQAEGWVSWKKIDSFDQRSFYNFCLPQLAGK
ncbi:UFSP1 protease, partial [Polyodon spathula]|nr:inactive Ufm1-specific protease 1 [Polyodon spathula]XP_041094319.1 inactive Ufm1-specific protease 1 [Polyodon spathula]XP_041094320.1 inactive Ufm1-specific protease 1 [Polyodon spathula]MBN3273236.1 UFSP1 protease [Polyodon spathula]